MHTFCSLAASTASLYASYKAVTDIKASTNKEMNQQAVKALVYPIFQILPTYFAAGVISECLQSPAASFILTKLSPVAAYLGKSAAIFSQESSFETLGIGTDFVNFVLGTTYGLMFMSMGGPIGMSLALVSGTFAMAPVINWIRILE
jgi:hypothetical protein